jgi:hypothetical protein
LAAVGSWHNRTEDGVVVIPPLPKVYAFLIVRTENMLPIGSGIISLFPRARRKQLDDPDARDPNDNAPRRMDGLDAAAIVTSSTLRTAHGR